jgi:N-acetylmuramoyl-L-alanine amidase
VTTYLAHVPCLLDTRTEAQEAAMIRLINDLLVRFPNAKVVGHKDMPGAATQCPGFDVRSWWAEVNKPEPQTNILSAIISALLSIFGAKK